MQCTKTAFDYNICNKSANVCTKTVYHRICHATFDFYIDSNKILKKRLLKILEIYS